MGALEALAPLGPYFCDSASDCEPLIFIILVISNDAPDMLIEVDTSPQLSWVQQVIKVSNDRGNFELKFNLDWFLSFVFKEDRNPAFVINVVPIGIDDQSQLAIGHSETLEEAD